MVALFFQAEDGIRDLVRSRGLGDVYKRQQGGRAGPTVENSGVKNSGVRSRAVARTVGSRAVGSGLAIRHYPASLRS